MQSFHNGRVVLHPGDCMAVLKGMEDCSVDSVVCDPPYHLTSIVKRFSGSNPERETYANGDGRSGFMSRGFMGKQWDGGDIAFQPELWAEVLRVLKPGGHLVAFSGTRTYHNMAVAIEKAGFEIRDMLQWLYGSGFPKSHDVSKGIDKAAGVKGGLGDYRSAAHAVNRKPHQERSHEGYHRDWQNDPEAVDATLRQYVPGTEAARAWQGWGTALKPACEPIAFARKPLGEKTVAANVLAHGTGALNIDGCRIGAETRTFVSRGIKPGSHNIVGSDWRGDNGKKAALGRWPANIIHDGSDEVVSGFPESAPSIASMRGDRAGVNTDFGGSDGFRGHTDSGGSAARFFYSAKADADDRIGSKHPTVKPVDLMRWLCRLVTPKGGTILDPFAGTGTTGAAAFLEGFNAILIERDAEYQADIARRMALLLAGPDEKARESLKARGKVESAAALPLFGGTA